ncbi:MAG: DegT/DnrJ/EryC1/StrS family aminotransferase, partial [Patescibacteria group bacterium]|nr:DegT/DnrJ/EryC1/StrS family aminotransferase [Patescibacteria group bacterium]
ALLAHNIKPGDEVITVSNSAVATALAISHIGGVPVFCDVKDNFLIDENKISGLITKKTKAILPVHLFGNPCDMKAINAIAKQNRLQVIEDACQAHGTKFKGEAKINTKAFSYYPTKNLGAIGEGGMIVTNSETVRDFAACYRNYGQKGRYNHAIKGENYRLDPLQCIFLDIKLKSLDSFVKKRRAIAKKYYTALRNIKGIETGDWNNSNSFHLFVVRVLHGQRNKLKKYLEREGVETLVHYPTPIHRQPCYIDEYGSSSLPKY